MQVLKLGMSAPAVERWQDFLIGQGFDLDSDGDFGPRTMGATATFQHSHSVVTNQPGVVDNATAAVAAALGFEIVEDPEQSHLGPNWPPKPKDLSPLISTEQRQRVFGTFLYSAKPDGTLNILGNWARQNIVDVRLPQLAGVKPTPHNLTVPFHKLAAAQLAGMFAEWEKAGLLPKVISWAGSFVPRMQRGSKTAISNHAFGTAFDINAPWNPLGAIPALAGKQGSVRELVEIANRFGFYWGGHFTRKDGMHFEVARIL